MSCKLCGSSETNFFFPGDERILKCNKCKAVFLSPKILPNDLKEYYSERFIAEKYVRRERLVFLENNARELLNIIDKYNKLKKETISLLDVGANLGIFIKEALRKGYKAMGIEPSKAMSAYAENLGLPVVKSVVEEYLSNYFQKRSFDIITIFHTLEHLANPIEVLKKLGSIHNKNGFLIIEVPNIESYMAKKDGISWRFIAYEHIFYFSPKTISSILQNFGYKIVKIKKRNSELTIMNIRKLIRYFLGKPLNRDRFIFKTELLDNYDQFKQEKSSLFKKLVRKILISAIKVFGREDHILVIAQKRIN